MCFQSAPIRYDDLVLEDIPDLIAMIRGVFLEFMAPAYTQEGVDYFLSGLEPAAIVTRLSSEDRFIIVARDNTTIVGAVEVKNHTHISLLFTAKDYHQKGIAKELLRLAITRCRETLPSLESITLNSSAYAQPVYQRLGFEPTGSQQERNGMIFTPMAMALTLPSLSET